MKFLILLSLLFQSSWLWAQSPPQTSPKPNIILIMTDDQGWGQTGYYKHPVLKTPNLDAMAANGLRFDRFYAGAPVCSPTRASVLTGRANNRTGVPSHGHALRLQEKTIAAALKQVGYATGHFGKWHLNGLRGPGAPILDEDPYGPKGFGFETWMTVTNFFDLDPLMGSAQGVHQFKGDSSEIIVNQALSGGISKTNGGQSLHQGAEGALGYAITSAWSVLANATYIPVAEFKGGTLGPIGNRIPYTPKLTGNLGLNYSKDGLKSFLNAYHVSSQYADSVNTVEESNDGTKGLIPAFTTLNWSVVYSPQKHLKLFGIIRNLFDKKFISGRSPDGIFPGAERNFEIGLAYQFY